MSDLVGNPEDRFSHDEAHVMSYLFPKESAGSGNFSNKVMILNMSVLL